MAKKALKSLPQAWGERQITQRGITLPYREEIKRYDDEAGQLMVKDVREGEVFVTASDLYELSEQDTWDSQFGKVLLLGHFEGIALEQAGLAIRETRGGYHRSDTLADYLDMLEDSDG